MAASKVVSLSEAVASVPDGANMTFGGFAAYFTPLAFVREVIRQGRRRIEMTSVAECWVADYLAGAGVLTRARFSNFMFEGLGRCYNFCRGVERGEIEVEDYSHFAITSRLVAAGLGIPFMPIKSMAGTDLMSRRNFEADKARPLHCPFTGEPVLLVPAVRPDVAVIHVARSDRAGNGQLFGYTAVVEEQARAAERVIVTAEEVVEDAVIRAQPELTVLPGFLVDAVVEVPFGLAPPEWIEDPQFDLDYHLRYVAVPAPGGMAELLDEMSPLYATAFDRERPQLVRVVAALRVPPMHGAGHDGEHDVVVGGLQ